MFESAVAFNRYRLEVMRSWPASKAKDKLMAAIECSSQKSDRSGPAGTPEGLEVVTGAQQNGRPGVICSRASNNEGVISPPPNQAP
jgi:hypothetical protein